MNKVTKREGKSAVTDKVFQGQAFIFNTNLNIQKPIQYNFYMGSSCHQRSDFKKAFAASHYTSEDNPFAMTPSSLEYADVMRYYNKESGSEFDVLETPDFVDNMLRLGQCLSGELWGVRFDGQHFILVISRSLNVFEISRLNPRKSLGLLDRDMQEFVDILSIVSQMEFIAKEDE